MTHATRQRPRSRPQSTALLVGGHPRSGTTILGNLLAHHPDIALTLELGSFAGLGQTRAHYREALARRRPEILQRNNLLPPRIKFYPANQLRIRWFLLRYGLDWRGGPGDQTVDLESIERALRRLLPRKRWVADKLPEYVFQLDGLLRHRGLSAVIIYRDARDVAASTLEMTRTRWRDKPWVDTLDSAEKVARRWVQAIEIMERQTEKVFAMRYESLVRDARQAMEQLGVWLDVDPAGFPIRRVNQTARVGAYEQRLTHAEIDDVMRIASPTLKRLNYIT